MQIPPDITELIDRGGLVAINHSGGKDSQAMTIRLVEAGIPRDQLLIVHATLGDVEWPGTISHIEQTGFGLPLVIATAAPVVLRDGAGAGHVPVSAIPPMHIGPETRSDRARAAPISRRQPPVRRADRECDGHARRRERRAPEPSCRQAERPQQRGGPDLGRLAADPWPHQARGVRDHRRRGAGAALGLWRWHVPPVLQLLHHVLARRSPMRRAAEAGASLGLHRPRRRDRPHAASGWDEPPRHSQKIGRKMTVQEPDRIIERPLKCFNANTG